MTVMYWDDRGSASEPWRPNYLYIISADMPLVVRAGFNPRTEGFRLLVSLNGSTLVDTEYERADACLEHAQLYCDERIPSVWLWRLVGDRDSNPRQKRVETRLHEPWGSGGRYAP